MKRAIHVLAIITAIFVTGAVSAAGAETSPYEADAIAAQSYADAYMTNNDDAMAALLADDAIFEDPANYFEGKDAILAGFKANAEKQLGQGPNSREIRKFRSGNYFIFAAWADFSMLMAPGGMAESPYRFELDFLMTLKVKDAKIIEHKDFVDTEAFVAQLQAQIAEKSAAGE